MMEIVIDEEKNAYLSKVIAYHLILITGKNMLASTSTEFLALNSYLNAALLIFVLLAYSFAIVKYGSFRVLSQRTFICVFAIAIFWGVSMLLDGRLFRDNTFPYSYVRKQARLFFAYGLPLFVAISELDLIKHVYSNLKKNSLGLFVIATVGFLYSLRNNSTSNDYSMSYGNNALFLTVLLFLQFIEENKKFALVGFAASTFYILVAGSRGPLVSIFVLILIGIYIRRKERGTALFCIFSFLALLLLLFFRNEILSFLANILAELGLNSRSINMLVNNKVNYDSGRSWYHDTLIHAINMSPLLGLGAFGGEKTVGLAHSFYLDVFANMGYLGGILFLLYVIINLVKIFLSDADSSMKYFLIMQFAILFPRAFFDESLWGNKEIWIILGIFVVYRKETYEKYSCNIK